MFEGSAPERERTVGKNLTLAPHWRFRNLTGVIEDHEKHKNSIWSGLACFLIGFANFISRPFPSSWPASVVLATADRGMLDRARW